jgi:large subunit ribosomal protein L18e
MRTGPTNQELVSMISDLKKKSIEQNVNLWKRLADDLSRSTRQRRIVNLMRIAQYAKQGEIVVVPGKVLGLGEISKKVDVAAFRFSGSAIDKIKQAGGTAISLRELMEKNPKGSKVRILG